MYVLADVEWAISRNNRQSITQIAAAKVNENWSCVSSFSSLVRPQNATFEDWKQVCYAGATPTDFTQAHSAYEVLQAFESWLDADDVLIFWFHQSLDVFSFMREIILRIKVRRPCIVLAPYLPSFLQDVKADKKNPYHLCQSYGIKVLPHEHVSVNDVQVTMSFLKTVQLPQALFRKPSIVYQPAAPQTRLPSTEAALEKTLRQFPFVLDVTDGIFHRSDCQALQAEHEFHGFSTTRKCTKDRCKPCRCVLSDIKQDRIKRNEDILNRSEYNYVFVQKSKVFHKPFCRCIRSTGEVLFGTIFYDNAVAMGRAPCKLCKPSPSDPKKPIKGNDVLSAAQKTEIARLPSKEERKAVRRQKQMVVERTAALREEGLSEQRINDIYTLTQPEFAFWAGKGKATFHRRACPRMVELTDLQGFKYFNQAIRAGLSPCRYCKPTAKQNIAVSVPFSNRVREHDTVELLSLLCAKAGYSCEVNQSSVVIRTPVGVWQFDTETSPIRVDHMHLKETASQFHRQPRVFLSLYDTFAYIRRHDQRIMEQPQGEAEEDKLGR